MRAAPRIISRHSTRDRAELALETMLIARFARDVVAFLVVFTPIFVLIYVM